MIIVIDYTDFTRILADGRQGSWTNGNNQSQNGQHSSKVNEELTVVRDPARVILSSLKPRRTLSCTLECQVHTSGVPGKRNLL